MGRWSLFDNWKQSMKGVCNGVKIRCPRNFVLIPGRHAYKTVKRKMDMSSADVKWINKTYGLNLRDHTYERDANGQKVENRDPKDYYNPEVTPGYALEHIYDPENPICKGVCRHQCVRKVGGYGNIGLIKRLKTEEKPIWQTT